MNIFKLKHYYFLLFFSLATFVSCDDNETPEPEIEEEEITTLNLTFTPEGGGDIVEATWKDLDGDGGNTPEISDISLANGQSYLMEIELLNENESPTENITDEVKEKAQVHQFFYTGSAIFSNYINVSYADKEADYPPNTGDKPVGLKGNIQAINTGSGTLTLTLKHEPDKEAAGVSDGDITLSGGESDIEASFNITIQ
ncbi:MAG: hypothetical protein KTR26_15225 [Flammeovirgaceae bacterium]|nr:hypothetical protein [Flammeovirgaceae bacterium]